MEPGLQLSQEQPPVKKKTEYARMSRDLYTWYIRCNPMEFFRLFRKSCSCEQNDLRLQDGVVECGRCGSKLRST